MHAIEIDAERLLAAARRQPWREVAAAAATRDPRCAGITAPTAAAPLALVPLPAAGRALVVGDAWGQLAVPLARRARVAALLPDPALAGLLACIAAQEGARLLACAGSLAAPPFAAGRFDAVLLHGDVAAEPHLLNAAGLLAAGGTLFARAANPLAGARLADGEEAGLTLAELRIRIAEAGLTPRREYACFPDPAQPRHFVPLALVGEFLRAYPQGGADLSRSGIAEHFAPAYAFVLEQS